MVQSGCSGCSSTGKVIFEWCKQVADHRDAPWSAEEPLPWQSAHVGHVRIVDWEAKDPGGGNSHTIGYRTNAIERRADRRIAKQGKMQEDHFEILISERVKKVIWGNIITFTYLSISVHQSMSSFSFMKTGKCWSLPCLMELDLVVMVLTLSNWQRIKERKG